MWIVYIVVIILMTLAGRSQITDLLGTHPKTDGSHGDPINRASQRGRSKTFIRRYAPDEEPQIRDLARKPGVSGSR
jgi:hypothetical protein